LVGAVVDPITNVWLVETVASLVNSPTVQNLVKGAVTVISDQLSVNHPMVEPGKLTTIDRRISMGVTRKDGEIVLALLVEKPDSSAARKAEDLASRFGGVVIPVVTGVAHSSKVGGGLKKEVELRVGTSVGHYQGYPGSIGCVVTVQARGREELHLTSAAHVLSMLNTAKKHDPILVPGHPDGPKVLGNKVGDLANYTYLTHYAEGQDWANQINHEDIAAVKLDNPNDWEDGTLVPVPDAPHRRKRVGDVVNKEQILDYIGKLAFKIGRTTDLTTGVF
jgi:hypothetical protein